MAPSGNPVDDGHGHFIRSGTNAHFHTTPFSRSKTGPQEEVDRYHGRIASALDIDRVRRILDFDTRATLPRARPQTGRHQRKSVKTIWDGAEWVNDDKKGHGKAKLFPSNSQLTETELAVVKKSAARALPAPPFKSVQLTPPLHIPRSNV